MTAKNKIPESMRFIAADIVLDHLNKTNDPALRSALWLEIVESIKSNPTPFVSVYGLHVPRFKA